MSKILKLSPSSLGMYWTCPELFRKIYIDKEMKKAPPSWKMVAGTAAHSGLECGLKAKIRGQDPSPPAMIHALEASFKKEWDKGINFTLEEQIGGGGDVYKKMALEKAIRCVAECHRSLIPKVNPISAEQWMEVEWRPGVQLRGKADLVNELWDRSFEVGDLKVGGRKTPYKDSAEKSHQLPIYAILIEMVTGIKITSGKLWHFVDSKRPHFTPRTVKITDRMKGAMRLKIDRTIDAIQAGVFPPGDPFWTCNAQRCPHHATCPMGAGVEDE